MEDIYVSKTITIKLKDSLVKFWYFYTLSIYLLFIFKNLNIFFRHFLNDSTDGNEKQSDKRRNRRSASKTEEMLSESGKRNGNRRNGMRWNETEQAHTQAPKVTRIAMRNNLAMEKIQKSSHQKAKLGAAKWYGSKFEEGKQNQMIPERIKNIPKVLHLIFFFNN